MCMLEEALKDTDKDIRLTNKDKWLVFDRKLYWVYEHKKYKKNTSLLIKTESLGEALSIFMS